MATAASQWVRHTLDWSGSHGADGSSKTIVLCGSPSGLTVQVDDTEHKIALGDTLGLLMLRSRGGDGDAGRCGKDGAPGRDGAPSNGIDPGQDGHDGNDGGNGLPGQDGGNGGHLCIRATDARLFALLHVDVDGGCGGKGGSPGTPGRGGKGGEGANKTQDDGSVIRLPAGKDGHDGNPGQCGSDGNNGHAGNVTYEILDSKSDTVLFSAPALYHLSITAWDLCPPPLGVYEPGTTVSFSRVQIHNEGPLPCPTGLAVDAFIPSSPSSIASDVEQRPLLSTASALAIPPHATVVYDCPVHVTLPPRHSTEPTTVPVALLLSVLGRPFPASLVTTAVESKFPVAIRSIDHPTTMQPGARTDVSVHIESLSPSIVGGDDVVDVALRTGSNATVVYRSTTQNQENNQSKVYRSTVWKQHDAMQALAPLAPYAVDEVMFTLEADANATPYTAIEVEVTLFLRSNAIHTLTCPIRLVPHVAQAEAVVVTSSAFTPTQHHTLTTLFAILDTSVTFIDTEALHEALVWSPDYALVAASSITQVDLARLVEKPGSGIVMLETRAEDVEPLVFDRRRVVEHRMGDSFTGWACGKPKEQATTIASRTCRRHENKSRYLIQAVVQPQCTEGRLRHELGHLVIYRSILERTAPVYVTRESVPDAPQDRLDALQLIVSSPASAASTVIPFGDPLTHTLYIVVALHSVPKRLRLMLDAADYTSPLHHLRFALPSSGATVGFQYLVYTTLQEDIKKEWKQDQYHFATALQILETVRQKPHTYLEIAPLLCSALDRHVQSTRWSAFPWFTGHRAEQRHVLAAMRDELCTLLESSVDRHIARSMPRYKRLVDPKKQWTPLFYHRNVFPRVVVSSSLLQSLEPE